MKLSDAALKCVEHLIADGRATVGKSMAEHAAGESYLKSTPPGLEGANNRLETGISTTTSPAAQTERYLSFFLPIPPSTNHLFANRKGGRCKTKRYRVWIDNVKDVLTIQKVIGKAIEGPCKASVAIIGGADFPITRDLDNAMKPILDVLQTFGVLPQDNAGFLKEIRIRHSDGTITAPACCTVTLEWIGAK